MFKKFFKLNGRTDRKLKKRYFKLWTVLKLFSEITICQCKFYKTFSRSVYILTKNRLIKYVHC